MHEAEKEILPYEQFEQLPKEKKIEYLTAWIQKYKVKGVIKHWNLKYPPDYYIRLKKLGIYQEIVGRNRMRNRSEKSHSEQMAERGRSSDGDFYSGQVSSSVSSVSDSMREIEHKRTARRRPAGIIRKIDELGRVVIPQETRSMLGISIFDALEVYTDEETEEIMVKKYSPGCIYCQSFDDLVTIKQKQICRACLNDIIHEAEARKAIAASSSEPTVSGEEDAEE